MNSETNDETSVAESSAELAADATPRGWAPISTEISSHLPFTPAVEANGFIFVSGQASVDATGAIISGTFEEEMRRSFANVESVLASAGVTLRDVVRVTSYVRDSVDGPRYNEVYREFFTAPLPARTTISNCLSPALKFEVDVIAVRPNPTGTDS
ncbi:MAG: RidA family protein [Actinobacteria bacterium]|jgi:2-iminobutanoate/2-iminopropanoate deaminase|nr:RidA family protein [Actinomycetota bacterium]